MRLTNITLTIMSQLNIIEIAKQDLYTAKAELEVRYPIPQVEHLLRLRDMSHGLSPTLT